MGLQKLRRAGRGSQVSKKCAFSLANDATLNAIRRAKGARIDLTSRLSRGDDAGRHGEEESTLRCLWQSVIPYPAMRWRNVTHPATVAARARESAVAMGGRIRSFAPRGRTAAGHASYFPQKHPLRNRQDGTIQLKPRRAQRKKQGVGKPCGHTPKSAPNHLFCSAISGFASFAWFAVPPSTVIAPATRRLHHHSAKHSSVHFPGALRSCAARLAP